MIVSLSSNGIQGNADMTYDLLLWSHDAARQLTSFHRLMARHFPNGQYHLSHVLTDPMTRMVHFVDI